MTLSEFITKLDDIAWGSVVLCLLVGVGLILSISTKFLQFRKFGHAMRNTIGKVFKKQKAGKGEVTPLQALTTALAVGALPAPMSGEAFCQYVKERFALRTLRCSAPVGTVTVAATSCGAGSSFAEKAYAAGAEAFVTGDVSYHHFFVPEGCMILDIGHYESEIDIVAKFVSVLQKNLPTFAVYTTENKQNNPVYYF